MHVGPRGLDTAVGSLVIAFVIVATFSAASVAQDPSTTMLWFIQDERSDPPRGFSSTAPEAEDEGSTHEGLGAGFGKEWVWMLQEAPGNWTMEEDAVWRVSLWLSRMNEVLPTGHPLQDPASVGSIRIELALEASVGTIGSGGLEIDPFSTSPEPTEYVIEVQSAGRVEFMAAQQANEILLTFRVTGRGVDGPHPVVFHLGSTATPSWLDAPGYPMEAFRAWEKAASDAQRCQERILDQQPCEAPQDDAPSQDETGRRFAPGPSLAYLLTAGILFIIACVTRSRRQQFIPKLK